MPAVITANGVYVLEAEEEFALTVASELADPAELEATMITILGDMLERRRRLEKVIFKWALPTS